MLDSISYQPREMRVREVKRELSRENLKWLLRDTGQLGLPIVGGIVGNNIANHFSSSWPLYVAGFLGGGYLGEFFYNSLIDEGSRYKKHRNRIAFDEKMVKKYNLPLEEVQRYDKPISEPFGRVMRKVLRKN